jgi:hypothetical protein
MSQGSSTRLSPTIGTTPAVPSELQRNLIERVCVGDITTRAAEAYADRPAIIDGDRSISFRQPDKQANRLGSALLRLGLARQDVVAVLGLPHDRWGRGGHRNRCSQTRRRSRRNRSARPLPGAAGGLQDAQSHPSHR